MRRIRDAQTIIGTLEDGDVASELGAKITDAVMQLKERTGGRPKAKAKGKVTLEIEIEVENGTATLTAAIVQKLPKPVRGSTFFWALDDGSLSMEHPQQTSMFDGPRALGGRPAETIEAETA